MRTYYAHPVDALRKFNPQMNENTLESGDLIGESDLEKVLAAIADVESRFEADTGRYMRQVRIGTPDRPETFESHRADMTRHQRGAKVWLDNRFIVPFDPDKGDALLVRRGRDRWKDITSNSNSYDLNSRKGYVRIYSRFRSAYRFRARKQEMFRVCYRHGAPGGRRNVAAQTVMAEPSDVSDTTLVLEDAAVFVPNTLVKIEEEYVQVTNVDVDSNEVEVIRGVRGTEPKDLDIGDVAHFCPADLRSAVAAKAAVEIQSYADWINEIVDADGMRTSDKVEMWNSEWEEAKRRYAEVRSF